MVVVHFKVRCKPEKADEALAVFRDLVTASRKLDGVIAFDMGRDLTDPNTFLALEVFTDRAAVDRQESLPETQKAINLLEEWLAEPPAATIYEVSSSEPWG